MPKKHFKIREVSEVLELEPRASHRQTTGKPQLTQDILIEEPPSKDMSALDFAEFAKLMQQMQVQVPLRVLRVSGLKRPSLRPLPHMRQAEM